ncbi:hypothetical protein I0600191H4_18230 [Collinsella sp. i06-0019-1H4]
MGIDSSDAVIRAMPRDTRTSRCLPLSAKIPPTGVASTPGMNAIAATTPYNVDDPLRSNK